MRGKRSHSVSILYLIILMALTALIFPLEVYAVPAFDRPFGLKQPSGKTFEARKRGDEWYNWVETKDGYGIYKNTETGNWEYYVPSDETPKKEQKFRIGRTQDTKKRAIVSEVDPATLGIPKGLRPPRKEDGRTWKPTKPKTSPQTTPHPSPLPQEKRESSLPQGSRLGEGEADDSPLERGAGGVFERIQKQPPESPFAKGDLSRFRTTKSATSTAVSGTMHLLVIGVDYDDCPATYSASEVQPLIFGNNNSVADYYNDVSYSAVTIKPAAESNGTASDGFIGWLRLSGNHPNPGLTENPGSSKYQKMVKDAISAADSYINYALYDVNGDGIVEPTELSITIIVAGHDEAAGSGQPSVWPHEGSVNLFVDGKLIQEYVIVGEKHSEDLATIGIMCHELGHLMFSLPDLYDADASNGDSQGIGRFDLMGNGASGAADGEAWGSSPTHLSAWSKEYLGWGTVNTISSSQTISLPKVDGHKASIFRINTSDSNQYFLIENREFTGYDKGFSMGLGVEHGGLVIYHVDKARLGYADDDETDKLVDVEEANEGSLGYSMLDSSTSSCNTNMFFFMGNNTSFTNDTIPGSTLKNGDSTGISITDISTYGDTMTATITLESATVSAPTVTTGSVTSVASNSAVLNGTVNANGLSTKSWFEYGTVSGTYSNTSTTKTVGGIKDTTINIGINGLSDGTTYYYRLTAENSEGTSHGTEKIFATLTQSVSSAPKISCGGVFSLALKSDGTVWAWGENTNGQLGDGTYSNSNTPIQVIGLGNITAIAAGEFHSLALNSNGTVLAWGDNGNGQLGDGTYSNSNTPVQVVGLSDVTSIAAGESHGLALKSDGTVWAWGSNYQGQLGTGEASFTQRNTPAKVAKLSGVIAVAGSLYYSLALKSDCTVWGWGNSASGQLGYSGSLSLEPGQIENLNSIIAIAAGEFHTLALKSDGTVWALGDNSYGQLGNGTTNNSETPVQVNGIGNIVAIAAGVYHNFALRSDGIDWAWGWNGKGGYHEYGQLGDGTTETRTTPVQVINISDVTAISAGSAHSLALKSDGTVWSWGDNRWGQLGDGTQIDKHTPIQIDGINLGETSADSIAPTSSININNGYSYTTSAAVKLNLAATDTFGVTGYYVSTSSTTPSTSDSGWTSVSSTTFYSDSVSYTLNSGDGTKTVYAWYKDATGNMSNKASDSIILDTTAPTVTITGPTSDSTYTTISGILSLAGSASDSGSGVSSISWSNNKGGSGIAIGTTDWFVPDIILSSGENVITVTATDGAGYTGTDILTITDNVSAPTPTIIPTQSPLPGSIGRIFGYVVGIADNPIESVRLKLKSLRTGAKSVITSDADGYFEFENLDADTYAIVARKNGYKKLRKTVNLEEGESAEIEIEMRKTTKRSAGLEESHNAALPQPKSKKKI